MPFFGKQTPKGALPGCAQLGSGHCRSTDPSGFPPWIIPVARLGPCCLQSGSHWSNPSPLLGGRACTWKVKAELCQASSLLPQSCPQRMALAPPGLSVHLCSALLGIWDAGVGGGRVQAWWVCDEGCLALSCRALPALQGEGLK